MVGVSPSHPLCCLSQVNSQRSLYAFISFNSTLRFGQVMLARTCCQYVTFADCWTNLFPSSTACIQIIAVRFRYSLHSCAVPEWHAVWSLPCAAEVAATDWVLWLRHGGDLLSSVQYCPKRYHVLGHPTEPLERCHQQFQCCAGATTRRLHRDRQRQQSASGASKLALRYNIAA